MCKLPSSRLFRCLICLLLVCCILIYVSPVRIKAAVITPTAAVVGVSATLLVSSILVAIGLEPLVESSLASFNRLVDEIVAALPSEFFATTTVAGLYLKLIFSDGISYAPRSLVEWIANYLLQPTDTTTYPAVLKSFSPVEISGFPYSKFFDFTVNRGSSQDADFANAINTMEYCSLLHFNCYDDSDGSFFKTYGYLWYNELPTFTFSTDKTVNGIEYSYIMELSSEYPFVFTVYNYSIPSYQRYLYNSTGVSSSISYAFGNFKKGAIYQDNKVVSLGGVSSVDSLTLTDDYALSFTDDTYASWTGQSVTITNDLIGTDVVSVPISVSATVEDVVASSRSEVIAGTETKAESVTIEDTVSDTTTDVSTGWLSTIVSWLESILNAIKALISGITTPIVKSLSDVIAAVKSVAVSITDFLTLKFENVDYYAIDLTKFFPFCIPFDLYDMLAAFAAEPEAPVFTFATGFLGQVFTVDIDLSPWDGVAKTVRTIQLCICIVGLAFATRKFIKW